MERVSCPAGPSSTRCKFIQRMGCVRDAKNVGLKECHECQLVIHDQDLSEMVAYSEGSMHLWLANSLESLPPSQSDISRRIQAIKSLGSKFEIQRVLDFGCGSGELISTIQENFDVCGLEPEKRRRENLNNLGVRCVPDLTSLDNKEQFDLITLFHVVEHLYEPDEILGDIRKVLRNEGLIIIETPNSYDALLMLYRSTEFSKFTYWSHHPYLYSKKALTLLLQRNRFKILESDGVQRYSLDNHLMWLSRGKPGGHIKWSHLFDNEVKNKYGENLIREGFNDTLFFVAQKLG